MFGFYKEERYSAHVVVLRVKISNFETVRNTCREIKGVGSS